MFESSNLVERMGHFNSIVPSLAMYSDETTWSPGNGNFKTLNFKMSLDALAHKNLCLWCEFQSCILFVISLLLLMFLTALLSIDNITLLGENRCWSLLDPKG